MYQFEILLEEKKLTTKQTDLLFDMGLKNGISVTPEGDVWLAFSRSAFSLESAIMVAVDNIREAGMGVASVLIDGKSLNWNEVI